MREKNRRAARGKDVKFMRGQAVKLMCNRCENRCEIDVKSLRN